MDGQYYQQLSSSRPPPRLAAGTPTLREGRVREQAATEADSHRTDGDSRQVQQHRSPLAGLSSVDVRMIQVKQVLCCADRGCVATTISTNSQTKENPYDFRHLLRKTSQRRKLIKQH